MKSLFGKRNNAAIKKAVALMLALSMVFGFGAVTRAEDADLSLAELNVTGVSEIEFDPTVLEYTVVVPQYYKADLSAEPLNRPYVTAMASSLEGVSTEVIYPEGYLDGTLEDKDLDGAQIKVVVTDGETENIYTITIDVTGANQLANGGFEEGQNTIRYSPGQGATWGRSTEAASTGSYGIKTYTTYLEQHRSYFTDAAVNGGQTAVQPGKTYLYSTDYRLPDNRSQASNPFQQHIKDINEESGAELTGTFYFGNSVVNRITTTAANHMRTENFNISKSWQTFSCLFTTDTQASLQAYIVDSTGAGEVYEDNFFLGEVVVGKVEVTDEYGAELGNLLVSEDEPASVKLKASVVNQLGGKIGIGDLDENIEWRLAEDYEGVEISEDGTLTVSTPAYSSVRVVAYAESDVHTLQPIVKGEAEIEIIDMASLPVAGLKEVKVAGMTVPGFKTKKFNYQMFVPYKYVPNQHTISLTEDDVEITPADADVSWTVTMPEEIDGGYIEINTTNTEGTESLYSIRVNVIGNNLFADGGFEKGVSHVGGTPGLLDGYYSQVEGNAGAGNYSLKVQRKADKKDYYYAAYMISSAPYAEPNKTYITSTMARLADDVVHDSYKFVMSRFSFGDVTKHYFNGEASSNQVFLNKEWQTGQGIISKHNGQLSPFFTDALWATGNQPDILVDELYVGELAVSEINYTGETILAIPESGSTSYRLDGGMVNQFGTIFGLEEEKIEWDLLEDYEGIAIEGNNIVVSERAAEGEIVLRGTVNPTFNSVYSFANTYVLNVMAEGEALKYPKAYDVTIEGTVKEGETLKADYYYHNAKNIDEDKSKTTTRWLYADTKTGTKQQITDEEGNPCEGLTYTVTSEYKDKYIFFEVTPVSVEGKAGKSVISDYLFKPKAPVVTSISVSGGGYVGATVKGTYTYHDENKDAENGTSFRWLRENSEGGFDAIDEAVTKEYIVTEDDIDKLIKFEVTPANDVDDPGLVYPAVSEGVIVATTPTVKDVEIKKVSSGVYRVSYDYEHMLDVPEGDTKILWTLDSKEAGDEISQEVSAKVKNISVSITPMAQKAPYEGKTVTKTLKLSSGGAASGPASSPSRENDGVSGNISVVPEPVIKEEVPQVIVPKHWAADGIEFVKNNGIMQDVAKGEFGNADIVTRADFIYYVMKTIGAKDEAYNFEFSDVTGADYYSGALQAAVNKGIISRDEKFNPMRSVSRQEVCKILVLAVGLRENNAENLASFVDSGDVSEWARGYVGAAAETGLLKGVGADRFDPRGFITREQTAVILKRINDYRNGGALS